MPTTPASLSDFVVTVLVHSCQDPPMPRSFVTRVAKLSLLGVLLLLVAGSITVFGIRRSYKVLLSSQVPATHLIDQSTRPSRRTASAKRLNLFSNWSRPELTALNVCP